MKIDPQLKKVLGLSEVSQVGMVVRNMDKALKNYSEIFGIEFPRVFIPEYFNRTYRGKPADFKYKIALGMMGNLEVELIEPMQGETTYDEFLEKWGEGIHHLGFVVKNIDERIKAFESLGIGILQSGQRIGARFAYMDTEKLVGVIIELIEREKKA